MDKNKIILIKIKRIFEPLKKYDMYKWKKIKYECLVELE